MEMSAEDGMLKTMEQNLLSLNLHEKCAAVSAIDSLSDRTYLTDDSSDEDWGVPGAMASDLCVLPSPVQCLECSKMFNSSKTLMEHSKLHDVEASCNICQVIFSRAISLSLHLQNAHHPSLLSCQTCKLTFSNLWQLNKHIGIHRTARIPPKNSDNHSKTLFPRLEGPQALPEQGKVEPLLNKSGMVDIMKDHAYSSLIISEGKMKDHSYNREYPSNGQPDGTTVNPPVNGKLRWVREELDVTEWGSGCLASQEKTLSTGETDSSTTTVTGNHSLTSSTVDSSLVSDTKDCILYCSTGETIVTSSAVWTETTVSTETVSKTERCPRDIVREAGEEEEEENDWDDDSKERQNDDSSDSDFKPNDISNSYSSSGCSFGWSSPCSIHTQSKMNQSAPDRPAVTDTSLNLCTHCKGGPFVDMENHVQERCTKMVNFQCTFCIAFFPTQEALMRHSVLLHRKPIPLSEECGKVLPTSGTMSEHCFLQNHIKQVPTEQAPSMPPVLPCAREKTQRPQTLFLTLVQKPVMPPNPALSLVQKTVLPPAPAMPLVQEPPRPPTLVQNTVLSPTPPMPLVQKPAIPPTPTLPLVQKPVMPPAPALALVQKTVLPPASAMPLVQEPPRPPTLVQNTVLSPSPPMPLVQKPAIPPTPTLPLVQKTALTPVPALPLVQKSSLTPVSALPLVQKTALTPAPALTPVPALPLVQKTRLTSAPALPLVHKTTLTPVPALPLQKTALTPVPALPLVQKTALTPVPALTLVQKTALTPVPALALIHKTALTPAPTRTPVPALPLVQKTALTPVPILPVVQKTGRPPAPPLPLVPALTQVPAQKINIVGTPLQSNKCAYCGNGPFFSMEHHMRNCEKRVSFECFLCKALFSTNASIVDHLVKTHNAKVVSPAGSSETLLNSRNQASTLACKSAVAVQTSISSSQPPSSSSQPTSKPELVPVMVSVIHSHPSGGKMTMGTKVLQGGQAPVQQTPTQVTTSMQLSSTQVTCPTQTITTSVPGLQAVGNLIQGILQVRPFVRSNTQAPVLAPASDPAPKTRKQDSFSGPAIGPATGKPSTPSPAPLRIITVFKNESRELALLKRLKMSWRAKSIHRCRQCGVVSRQPSLIVRHRYLHRGPRPHRCHCGRAFRCRLYLLRHCIQHAEATSYICVACGETFVGARVFAHHVAGTSRKAKVTGGCRRSRPKKRCLVPFSCHCGKTFKRPSSYLWHQLRSRPMAKLA